MINKLRASRIDRKQQAVTAEEDSEGEITQSRNSDKNSQKNSTKDSSFSENLLTHISKSRRNPQNKLQSHKEDDKQFSIDDKKDVVVANSEQEPQILTINHFRKSNPRYQDNSECLQTARKLPKLLPNDNLTNRSVADNKHTNLNGVGNFKSKLPRLQPIGASKKNTSLDPSRHRQSENVGDINKKSLINDNSKIYSGIAKPRSDFFMPDIEASSNNFKNAKTSDSRELLQKIPNSPKKDHPISNGDKHKKFTVNDSRFLKESSVEKRLAESEDIQSTRIGDERGGGAVEKRGMGEYRRKESWEDGQGRTFTQKSGKAILGSSTTLSSNTESVDDTSDVYNVVLRVRPLNSQEKSRRDKFVAEFPGDGLVSVKNSGTSRKFQFNVVFEPDATQEDVFENCGMKRLVDAALNGFTCTVFAFGQTGSGKTHTMTGPPGQFHTDSLNPDPRFYGVIQRSFKYLFQQLRRQGEPKIVRASYLEIYNEQVIDLLNSNHGRHLAVRWSKNKGFYVENLFTVLCETIDDLMAVLEEGLRNRQTGSHGLNEFSSRSHSVLTVTIDSETRLDQEDESMYITNKGKLSFVDLAGSEKVKDSTPPGGTGMMESNNINKSLLVLGNCISHLGDAKRRQGHIPYRDSKLTKLLSDSLAGNGITLMIACITPSSTNITETVNTLRYASRAKTIKTRPTVKMDPRETLIVSLKKEVRILRQENHYLRQQLDFPAKPKGQLQKENDDKFLKFMKQQEQKESGLYEMLQEYMVENESLRADNSEMQSQRESSRREQQILYKENEKLTQRVDELERLLSRHPGIWTTTNHHRTDGYSQRDLSPRGSPNNVGYVSPTHRSGLRPIELPAGDVRNKVESPGYQNQTMKPPHWLPDHVVRPAPRPVEYIEQNGYTDSHVSPRHSSVTKAGPGVSSFRPREFTQQQSQTGLIREMNDRLLMEVRQLDGEIAQHTRAGHASKSSNKDFNR